MCALLTPSLPQITHLTNMKDADRLNLLKDVAGTKVYETRRADSLRIMQETDEKKAKIDETLTYIQDRLAELQEERSELNDFREKDKERRSLEYTLHQRDANDVITRLDDLVIRRKEEAAEADDKQKRFFAREKELKNLEDELTNLQHRSTVQVAERDSLLQERRDLARTKAEIEAQINDDEERDERLGGTREELQQRLNALDERISAVEGELMGLEPSLDDQMTILNDARNRLEASKARIQVLFGKRGRSTQYRTQAERDEAIRAEIQSLEEFKNGESTRKAEVQAETVELQQVIANAEKSLAEKAEELEERRQFIEESAKRWDEVRAGEDKLLERKKELWKEEHKLDSSVKVAQERFGIAQRSLSSMMDRATATGLANVDTVTQRLGLRGVYGPLYKLFTVQDTYKTAVEVTAGQSLFHVVVDTDETASRLIEEMNREKLGRVTFMPLNRLNPKVTDFHEKTDAMLMLRKLTFDQTHAKAMQQVFGRMIICKNLTIASSYVQSSKDINAITLDGDKVERKGALTGGYNDPKRSRLDAAQEAKRWKEVLVHDEQELARIRTELQNTEASITSMIEERQSLESRSKRANRSREPILQEVRSLRETETAAKKRLQRLQEWSAQLTRDLETIETKKAALQQEINTPLNAGLSAEETTELERLNREADEGEKTVTELMAKVSDMSTQRDSLEIELADNLKRERETIVGRLETLTNQVVGESQVGGMAVSAGGATAKAELQKRLAGLRAQIADKQKKLERIEREIEENQQKIKEKQDQIDSTTRDQIEEARSISRHEKVLSKIVTKRREYEQRKVEVDEKLRQLGLVSNEALQKYADMDTSKVLKQLHKMQASLKEFSNVNVRAIEQYDQFARERDNLLERQGELDKSSESITELIDSLDMRKDEAIERTFKQVSKNFVDVFEQLVPMGRGALIMQKRFDTESQENEESDEDAMDEDEATKAAKKIENYIGVSIKVSFHSKLDEGLRIQQLSGGQKSLVALALIFAIQKCDPAAFYLFDEIDANLDAQYRTAVATMIQQLSENAQFITTTFRPELVGVGDKHYGVFFSAQKVSSLQSITQDEAFRFVEASAEAAQT